MTDSISDAGSDVPSVASGMDDFRNNLIAGFVTCTLAQGDWDATPKYLRVEGEPSFASTGEIGRINVMQSYIKPEYSYPHAIRVATLNIEAVDSAGITISAPRKWSLENQDFVDAAFSAIACRLPQGAEIRYVESGSMPQFATRMRLVPKVSPSVDVDRGGRPLVSVSPADVLASEAGRYDFFRLADGPKIGDGRMSRGMAVTIATSALGTGLLAGGVDPTFALPVGLVTWIAVTDQWPIARHPRARAHEAAGAGGE